MGRELNGARMSKGVIKEAHSKPNEQQLKLYSGENNLDIFQK